MKRILFLLLAVYLGAMGPEVTAANESDTASVTVLSDSIVVTANRFGMNREKSIWPVTVLRGDELKKYTDLSEAVDGKAGVDIRNYNGYGSVSTLSSWGLFNRHMLLLYNGRVVKDYSLGGFNLANFSVEEFDRIEILKGPQSAFYGSDAVGGVVNLIRHSSMKNNLGFSVKQGSNSFEQYTFEFSHNMSGIIIDGLAEFSTTENARKNAGAERTLFNVSIDYLSKNNKNQYHLGARYFNDSLGVPGPVPHSSNQPVFGDSESSSLYDHQIDENYSFDFQYRYEDKNKGSLQLDVFNEKYSLDYNYRYQDYMTYDTIDSRSITNKRSSGVNIRYLKQFSIATLAGGVDWLSGSVLGIADDKRFDNSHVLYNSWTGRQDQFDVWSNMIYHLNSDFDLDLSGRFQFIKKRKTQPSYNMGLGYRMADHLRLKLGYAYAFRLPSISEQFAEEIYTAGNEAIKPETSRSLVATVNWSSGSFETSVSFFKQNVDSLIKYYPNEMYIYVPQNVEKYRTKGVEISSNFDISHFLTVGLSGVYQNAEQSDNSGKDFSQADFIPELKWRFDLDGGIERFSYGFDVSFTSNRNAKLYNGNKVLPKVYELGANIGYEFLDGLNGSFVVYDLTDEKRADQFGFSQNDNGYPGLGRRFILSLSYKL